VTVAPISPSHGVEMRIAIVSTFPPAACGIGTYSAKLRDALRGAGITATVLAEDVAGAPDQDGVVRAWHRRDRWVGAIVERVRAAVPRPAVVHVQHEEAILGQDGRMPALCEALRALGVATVVTLHSVYRGGLGWLPGRWGAIKFQRALGRAADRLIVHQQRGGADWLAAQDVAATVIPHGTELLALPPAAEARRALGYGASDRIVLSLGFIHRRKGTHTLLRAFGDVVHDIPEARLVIAGRPRTRTPFDAVYRRHLERLMRPGLGRWIDYRPGFLDDTDVIRLLAAADVVSLAYNQPYGSASGILHTALGAGRAVLCARQLKFADAIDAWGERPAGLYPAAGRPADWARALVRVLSDDVLRGHLAERSSSLAAATAWPAIAARHAEVYRATASAAVPRGSARSLP
jgi:polysaccharide biosynthesis protein PslF